MLAAKRSPAARDAGRALENVSAGSLDIAEDTTPHLPAQVQLRLQRHAEALHARGPRPVGELLLELVGRWGPAFAADLERRLVEYNRISVWVYQVLGGDRFPSPPIHEVRR